jgi:hypothetical protein
MEKVDQIEELLSSERIWLKDLHNLTKFSTSNFNVGHSRIDPEEMHCLPINEEKLFVLISYYSQKLTVT